MLWYGIEPLASSDPSALARLASVCALPITRQCLARRLAEDYERDGKTLDQLLSAAASQSPDVQADLLTGIGEALAGRRKAPKPASWDAASSTFAQSPSERVQSLARDLAALFGDGRALDAIRAIALDASRDLATRRAALRSLIDARAPGLRQACETLFTVRDLSATAADGLSLTDDPTAADFMLERYRTLYGYEKAPVLGTLVSRPAWARKVLDAVADGKIPRTDLSAFLARQIRTHNDTALNDRLAEIWGALRDPSSDAAALIAAWKQKLTSQELAKADLAAGRLLYQSTCASCHKLYGEGGTIGPDLTGGNRDNLDYLLQNILDPSAQVPADYRMSLVATNDGRILSGIVKSRTDKTLALQTPTEVLNLDQSDVEDIRPSELSLMPEGLFAPLSADQIRDLLGFLMAKEPPPGAGR
jgi:putative heme-binding domain-containing protein